MDDHAKRKELKRLQRDLTDAGLSRREFVSRLKGLGFGFGAAFMLGLKEANALAPDALAEGLDVKSTNPAVDRIIQDAQDSRGDADVGQTKLAYTRFYPRYARYGRYGRYARYARVYGRVYSRGYGKYLPPGAGGGANPHY